MGGGGEWNGFHPIYLIVIWQTDNENRDDAPAFAFIAFSDIIKWSKN